MINHPPSEERSPGRRRGLALRGGALDAPRLPRGRGGQQRPGGGETRHGGAVGSWWRAISGYVLYCTVYIYIYII